MPIPDFQSIMLPLLKYLKDGKAHSLAEITEYLAQAFHLTDEERKTPLPSGRQSVLYNRVTWSRLHMQMAQLLESTQRGIYRITDRGQAILKRNLPEIKLKTLEEFPEYVDWRFKKNSTDSVVENEKDATSTPEESLKIAHEAIFQRLAQDLLDAVKTCSPKFFETLVVDLLVSLGYGGSRLDAGSAIGKSGDEGIDGIIKEDRLGLDIIYIQAKRWSKVIGRPEIQEFVGAIEGQRAKKGVFISTSTFSKQAVDYVSRINSKIVLIDGLEMAKLMIDFNVGVSLVANYEIKKIDLDYFIEE